MTIKHSSARRWFSAIALSSCLVTGLAAISMAQGLSGLTVFSGVDREYQLGYRLDYEGRTNFRDRYRLRIPAEKMDLAVARFAVSYPDTFEGRFDADSIEVRVRGDSVSLDEVNWDQENRLIEIYPEEPIPAGTRVELVFSNVRNPRNPGTHYFNALVQSPGDVPLLRYIGTWIIQISRTN